MHTIEPWKGQGDESNPEFDDFENGVCILNSQVGIDEFMVAWIPFQQSKEQTVETARRVIACVNACVGITTEQMEDMVGHGSQLLDFLIEEPNE